MTEKLLELQKSLPSRVYGNNNRYLQIIQSYYPTLKITARGNELKATGPEDVLMDFEAKIEYLIMHFDKYQSLSENQLERILTSSAEERNRMMSDSVGEKVLVYGVNGHLIKAQTPNQQRIVEAVEKSDMVFAVGPAGTGKTYTAVALAVRALKNKQVKRIILTRPAVEAGENLGFLPGDLKEKLDPYLQPLYDALLDMIPHEKLAMYIESGVIQIAPLAFMRGRTLDNAFVILDEAQNTTEAQMKMFLTRMGRSAKFVITGDFTQIDLPKNQRSGLVQALKILKNIEDIAIVKLDDKDVIRHKLVKRIIQEYRQFESDKLHPDQREDLSQI
ncbi:MAG: PhoH family protein [Thermaurantimonas sp.]|uniref:PhoH family protein n=1 Tax=Thermaurantimonas sp. TaxID=2681568 RepID=UPI00391A998B